MNLMIMFMMGLMIWLTGDELIWKSLMVISICFC